MTKSYELNRADPNCPICNRSKDKHTPKEAQICFSKIRKGQE